MAQPYRSDSWNSPSPLVGEGRGGGSQYVLAFEALEVALRGLKEEVTRTANRCQEVRRAYERLVDAAASDGELPRVAPDSTMHRLTPRERLVAALAAEGRSNAQVAAELHVSLHTVKSQMRSVLRKLEIESRWQMNGSWPRPG